MADNSFDRDDLVAEIRKELGVRVERSDPILAAGVVNDFMLRRTLDMLRREIEAHSGQYLAAIEQTPKVAEKAAVEMIDRAGIGADKLIRQAGTDAAAQINKASDDAAASIQQAVRNEIQKIEKLGSYFRAVVSVVGIAIVFAAALWVGVKIGYMLPLPAKH